MAVVQKLQIFFIYSGTYEMAKDLFNREETNRRIFDDDMGFQFKEGRQSITGAEGVVFNHGKKWQEQRRFMLTTLRDFGFGKSDMEGMINEEVKCFLDYAEENLNKDSVGSISVSNRVISYYIKKWWAVVGRQSNLESLARGCYIRYLP
jgi:hypothetical protein